MICKRCGYNTQQPTSAGCPNCDDSEIIPHPSNCLYSAQDFMLGSFNHPARYSKYKLSPAQREILRLVIRHGADGITTTALSVHNDCSIYNAANRLKALYAAGWLSRERVISNSGGIHHIYRCEPTKWGNI